MAGKWEMGINGEAGPGVLVVVGSFQSLGILRSLAGHGIQNYLIDWDLCVARFSKYTNRFSTCPRAVEEERFVEFLCELAVRENIKGWLIFPNDDRTVGVLARNKKVLEEFYRVSVPEWDIVKQAIDKRQTYRLAEQVGIPFPKTFYPGNVDELQEVGIEFPAVIKPAIRDNFYDKARKKAVRADDREQLLKEYMNAASLIDSSEIMVQELIPGAADNLYSYGSLHSNGRALGKVVARRTRQHPAEFGRVTTHAETMHIPELETMATLFLDAMGYQGISEVEFMWDPRDEKYKLIEINARFWSWHSLAIAAGVDLPYLLYRDMLGHGVRIDDFEDGVHWIRLLVDLPTSAVKIARGKIGIRTYLKSWKGKKTFAVWSLKDPLPFLAEMVMVPYIAKIRGI